MAEESFRIPLETAHQFLATFGITKPTRAYERWVKEDGFDSQDFGEVLADSPFIFIIDWRASLGEELETIRDSLDQLGTKLEMDLEDDVDSGVVVCNGRNAKVHYLPNDENPDFDEVIRAIQEVMPSNIEFRSAPTNSGGDTWVYAVLPRDEWQDLEKLDSKMLDSFFRPMG